MIKYYSYKCNSCAHREDKAVEEKEKDSQRCPICCGLMVRVISYSGMYTIKGDNSGSTPPKSKVK